MLNPPLSDGEGKPPKVARGWGFKFENSTSAESRQVKIQKSKFKIPISPSRLPEPPLVCKPRREGHAQRCEQHTLEETRERL